MPRFSRPAALATAALLCLPALLGLSEPASAAEPRLRIPDFSHLRQAARDTTDITVGTPLLRFASAFVNADEDDQNAQALRLLENVDSVRVRNYEFDSDHAYSRADIEAVRRQLSAPGWTAIVQAHERDQDENVEVYLCTEGGKVLGLAVIASEPRSFTIVNVVGNFDIDKLSKLEGQFGIPRKTRP